MPKILITGNGFDLYHKLPTTYSDFIRILKNIGDKESLCFNKAYSCIENYNDFKKNYKEFQLDNNKIRSLKPLLKSNVWFEFFQHEYKIESWIDFEIKIEEVLNTIFCSLGVLQAEVFGKGSIPTHASQTLKADLLKNQIQQIAILKKFGIINDFFRGGFTLNQDFLNLRTEFRISYYTGFNIEKIVKQLNVGLKDFKQIFNYYFDIFIIPLYQNKQSDISLKDLEKVDNHYTFNYTPTFEKFYNTKSPQITQYLHSGLSSDYERIVLGINEIPHNQTNKKYLIPFTKYFQKLHYNSDYQFLHNFETNTYEKNIIFFFGHSLDKSDSNYVNDVFEFIKKIDNLNKSKIIIIYHNDSARAKLLINLLDIRGKEEIEKLMKDNILIFEPTDSQNLSNLLNTKTQISPPNLSGMFH